MKTEEHKSGLYYVILSAVLEDTRLEHSEIVFYALLSGLATVQGYCFASDEYLAKRMRCKERTVRDWLLRLEKFGYIERETKKEGMLWDRKIFVHHGLSKSSYERHPSAVRSGGAVPDREALQCRIVSKENIEGEETTPTPSKGMSASPPLVRLDFGKFVKLTKEEHEELCSKYGAKNIALMIEEMNDYFSSTGKKPSKDYAATIRSWFRRRETTSSPSPSSSRSPSQTGPSQAKENMRLAESVYQKYSHTGDIKLGSDYIEFLGGPNSYEQIKFSEHGFRERVLNKLRKWSWSLDGL